MRLCKADFLARICGRNSLRGLLPSFIGIHCRETQRCRTRGIVLLLHILQPAPEAPLAQACSILSTFPLSVSKNSVIIYPVRAPYFTFAHLGPGFRTSTVSPMGTQVSRRALFRALARRLTVDPLGAVTMARVDASSGDWALIWSGPSAAMGCGFEKLATWPGFAAGVPCGACSPASSGPAAGRPRGVWYGSFSTSFSQPQKRHLPRRVSVVTHIVSVEAWMIRRGDTLTTRPICWKSP